MSAAPREATPAGYVPLTVETIPERLGALAPVRDRLGEAGTWRAREVGDGNLNLVFVVEGRAGTVVVKQALPYVRLVGESWPLPLSRTYYEYHALTRQAARAPGTVPSVFHFDEDQALIVMEYLAPHRILRRSLVEGVRHPELGPTLGRFCAETLFRGSDLSLPTPERKADVALFAGNAALCDITENLVFDEPYFDAPMNGAIPDALAPMVTELRADAALKVEVQHLKRAFCNHAETLLHGDLHTGSIMVHEGDARVIDPEFALYGPMGLDLGMLLANYAMAWFAQPGHATATDDRRGYRGWIVEVMRTTWHVFETRFAELWRTERTGILYPARLYEAQGHDAASERALGERLAAVWSDALGFMGVEIHRRTIGLARIVEYESIEDAGVRARLQGQGLRFGRELVLNRTRIGSIDDAANAMRRHGEEDIS